MSNWEETPTKAEETLERLSRLAWEYCVNLLEQLEEVWGKRGLGFSSQVAAPKTLNKWKIMNGWMSYNVVVDAQLLLYQMLAQCQ